MFKWGLFSGVFELFFFPSGEADVLLLTEEIEFTIKQ